MQYDVAVIGGGPGGYVAAVRAAQLGGRVLLAEKEDLGGVCLNRGCIPTKTLLQSVEKWSDLRRLREFGLHADNIGFDYNAVAKRKDAVVAQLRKGIGELTASYGIDVIKGTAILTGPKSIAVAGDDEKIREYTARRLIIATGSRPTVLKLPGSELPAVITSDELLMLREVPKSLLVVGGGAVGLEFAVIMRAFGCEVTIVEMLPEILPGLDRDLVKRMGLVLRKQGVKILANARVLGFEEAGNEVRAKIETKTGLQEVVAEKVLAAAGRFPATANLGLEAAKVEFDRNGVKVDERMETSTPGIYAVGDITGGSLLAHAAIAAGKAAAENAMGQAAVVDFQAVPSCIFTLPEIAAVGLTEQEALAGNREIKVSRFHFAANGKAVTMGETEGMVKIVACAVTGKVLGMHILGPHACDLIMEGVLAIHKGLTADDIASAIHPHPTLSEAVMESACGIGGDMVHQAKRKEKS
jgi:dihydrolipoamide dehydrogenase